VGNTSPVAFADGPFTVAWGSSESDLTKFNVIQSGWQFRGVNFENYEGIGVEPDKTVPFSWKDFTNNGAYDAGGTDAQLEAAIDYVRAQQ
jgi:hypothetical protein